MALRLMSSQATLQGSEGPGVGVGGFPSVLTEGAWGGSGWVSFSSDCRLQTVRARPLCASVYSSVSSKKFGINWFVQGCHDFKMRICIPCLEECFVHSRHLKRKVCSP